MPLKDIEHWEIINITNPIKDIQNMIKQDKPVGRSIPTELLHLYSTDEFQMLGVTMQLAPSQLFTIETTVKRKLTEIILELEKEFVDICLWQDKRTYNCSPKVHNSASSLG